MAKFLYTWSEEHESKISDQYLTWGWNSEDKKILLILV